MIIDGMLAPAGMGVMADRHGLMIVPWFQAAWVAAFGLVSLTLRKTAHGRTYCAHRSGRFLGSI